jgi:hypothetical protein
LNSDNVLERLDRKPAHNWLDLCKEDSDGNLARLIIENTPEDFEYLTRSTMKGILMAIKLQLSGKIRIGGVIPKAGYLIDKETAIQIESGVGFRDISSTDGEEEVVCEIPRMYAPDNLLDSR